MVSALQALAKTGDARAAEPLIAHLRPAIRNRNKWTASAICEALVQLGKPAVNPLLAMLGEPAGLGHRLEERVIPALVAIGDQRAVAPLIALLQADRVGSRAVEALVELGGADIVNALVGALHSKNHSVRTAAARALAGMGDPRAIDPLMTLLAIDEKGWVREAAARALAQFDDKRVVGALSSTLRQDRDDRVRTEVASLLRERRSEQAFAILEAAINHKWVPLKDLAQRLAYRAKERDRDLLRLILNDQEAGEARAIAAAALAHAGDDDALNILLELLESGDENAAKQVQGLADTRAIHSLIKALGYESTRGIAVTELGRVGDARAVRPLVAMLTSEYPPRRERYGASHSELVQKLRMSGSKEAALGSLETVLRREVENVDIDELFTIANLDDQTGYTEVEDHEGYLLGLERKTLDCSQLRSLAEKELSRRGIYS
jgi:HEAT repeat protein